MATEPIQNVDDQVCHLIVGRIRFHHFNEGRNCTSRQVERSAGSQPSFVSFQFSQCISGFPGRLRLVPREAPALHCMANEVFLGPQTQLLHTVGSIGFDLAGTDLESGSNIRAVPPLHE